MNQKEILSVELLERRVVGSLLLMLGLSFLVLGLYSGQLSFVLDLVKEVFETAISPLVP